MNNRPRGTPAPVLEFPHTITFPDTQIRTRPYEPSHILPTASVQHIRDTQRQQHRVTSDRQVNLGLGFRTAGGDCMDVGRFRILVVDDIADVADSTAELLNCWGYDALACYDGATALESARAREPDAVLLDIAMPSMDGFEFARRFREPPGRESVPIVAISGYTGLAYHACAREVGIQHYLPKPADLTRLRELLTWEVERAVALAPAFDQTGQVQAQRAAKPEFVIA